MLAQQYLPGILDRVDVTSTDAICQQIGLCGGGQATTNIAAAAVPGTPPSSSAASRRSLKDLTGCGAHYVLNDFAVL